MLGGSDAGEDEKDELAASASAGVVRTGVRTGASMDQMESANDCAQSACQKSKHKQHCRHCPTLAESILQLVERSQYEQDINELFRTCLAHVAEEDEAAASRILLCFATDSKASLLVSSGSGGSGNLLEESETDSSSRPRSGSNKLH